MGTIKTFKVIFLDRDGVINKKAPEGDYIKNWKEFHFLEKVPEAIHIFNDLGFKVVVVSNQRGIAKRLMIMSDVNYIHEQINKQISAYKAHIDAFFVCPHETWIPEIRNESFDRVSPIIYFQEQPTAV